MSNVATALWTPNTKTQYAPDEKEKMTTIGVRVRVEGSRFSKGLGFRVEVSGVGFRIQGSRSRVRVQARKGC